MKKPVKKPKTSKAVRDIVAAFMGLLPVEQEDVLRQLGLMKDPVAAAERELQERSRVMPSSSSDLDWSDLQCAPGEQGIGLPHPDLMTPEEKALYYPKRWRPQESGQLEKTPKMGGLRDPR